MKRALFILGVLLSAGLFCACSKDDNEEKDINSIFSSGLYVTDCIMMPSFSLGDKNVLFIQDENGKIDTCGIYSPYCGTTGPITTTGSDNVAFENYPMVFSTAMWYSANFNELQLGIENRENKKIEDLEVSDSFSTFLFDSNNKIFIKVWWEDNLITDIPYQNMSGALGGRIEVVDKRTDSDGITYITLSLEDLEFYSYDKDMNQHNYHLNGKIEFRINENGLYPKPEESVFDMETALIPNDDLIWFMMNALYKSESEGRKTFFSQAPEEEKCLIINSQSEFREAYHGDMEVPRWMIDFNHCSLVIGRTYGAHGGVSLGDYEFTDNGDSYQLNLTINNNVNPDYYYPQAVIDLYFWKICPKMENKPVVFNRIRQDVNIDPMQESSLIRKRWLLECYADVNHTTHQLKEWGDERYTIEFKENGKVEGRINTNGFDGHYTMPHMMTIDGKRDGYNGDLHYGLLYLTDLSVSEVFDGEPLSDTFMHIFNATKIKLWSQDIMTITTSDGEVFGFFRENIKELYGYK
jgi:hypothetical protein